MKLVSVETPEKSVCKMTFSATAEELDGVPADVQRVRDAPSGRPTMRRCRARGVRRVPRDTALLRVRQGACDIRGGGARACA